MLPLDTLPKKCEDMVRKRCGSIDDIVECINLDLDGEGNFAKSILFATREKLAVLFWEDSFGIDEVPYEKDYREIPLCDIENIYEDSFVSTARLIVVTHGISEPFAFTMTAGEQKLSLFVDILTRIKAGNIPSSDDVMFKKNDNVCPKCKMPYDDPNIKICKHCVNKSKVFSRLLHYFSVCRGHLAIAIVAMFGTFLLGVLSPYLTGTVLYGKVLTRDHIPLHIPILNIDLDLAGKVVPVVLAVFIVDLLLMILGIIQRRSLITIANRISLKLKNDIFTALQKLSLSYFASTQTGKLITRVNYDADNVRNFFINIVPYVIVNGAKFVAVLIILFMMNAKLTLFSLIPIPIIVIVVKKFFPKLWKSQSKIWRRNSSMNGFLGDTLNGIRVVKAFAKETEETQRFSGYNQRLYKATLEYNALSLLIFPALYLMTSVSQQTVWLFCGVDVIGTLMNFGEMITFVSYVGYIYSPIEMFTGFAEQLTTTANCAQRMFEILDAVPEIYDAPDAKELDIKGKVEFSDVCFNYPTSRRVIDHMSFDIKAGENVGLVGHTGSGKTTIANLIMRLYDPTQGEVKIDGENLRNVKNSSLRSNIAVVSQEVFLFRGTIADNIGYAKPDATYDEIVAAARAANAHDFIMSLPDGYETQVGTGSRSLSGGEKQRISIARAVLMNPKILILDEATAAMDTVTEKMISEALSKLTENRTTLVIAHRLSTLKDCSRLFVIENGRIVENGTPEELLEKKGEYYKLYTLQSDAYDKIAEV